ncbi:MAG: helix-turn-helix domain-containing protein [Pirellulales bacterium]|nr:helix-turn-helix domain-containing protein [Pirellulales bacterium]
MSAPRGRQRKLTPNKQTELCRLVSRGLSIAEAADQVDVSLRTVQREIKREEDFEHDLQLAQQAAPVDPLKLMQQAAKAHWRAAAWLLERTDERFARRRCNSCGPEPFKAALEAVVEAALKASEPSQRTAVYKAAQAVVDDALQRIFPDRAPLPFTAPSGLNRNIHVREAELDAFLDEVAQDYRPPAETQPPETQPNDTQPRNSQPADAQPDPEPAAAPAPQPPRHRPRAADSFPAADPAAQALFFGKLADRLRQLLAERAAAQQLDDDPRRQGILSPKMHRRTGPPAALAL